MKNFFALLLLAITLPVFAEASVGTNQASARITISVTVLPTMQVTSVTPVPGGIEYRGFTNMKSAVVGGTYVTFSRVGEFTVVVPTAGTVNTQFVDGITYQTVSNP